MAATLEVDAAPDDGLIFWALQASVHDDRGRNLAGIHLGLQAHPEYPGGRAVNFGGYDDVNGGELDGTVSPHPSTLDNPNTRDFLWHDGQPHVLELRVVENDGVAGLVDGELVRALRIPNAAKLVGAVVWTEDFRPCDATPTTARWSDLTVDGTPIAVVATSYTADCSNTNSDLDGARFVQRTRTRRTNPAGTVLHLPAPHDEELDVERAKVTVRTDTAGNGVAATDIPWDRYLSAGVNSGYDDKARHSRPIARCAGQNHNGKIRVEVQGGPANGAVDVFVLVG